MSVEQVEQHQSAVVVQCIECRCAKNSIVSGIDSGNEM